MAQAPTDHFQVDASGQHMPPGGPSGLSSSMNSYGRFGPGSKSRRTKRCAESVDSLCLQTWMASPDGPENTAWPVNPHGQESEVVCGGGQEDLVMPLEPIPKTGHHGICAFSMDPFPSMPARNARRRTLRSKSRQTQTANWRAKRKGLSSNNMSSRFGARTGHSQ
jgi:hypothetical protein